ncbi:MAG: ABC transporter ATP-binding protein [Spirochaetales bacterium]|nr:ABC transporter ATP-binding protein [Spirochaetales bacterium]
MSRSLIELNNLTYRFRRKDDPVLEDISFSLEKGTFNILVGPGGSGKSTLCRILDGRIPHLLRGDLTGDVFLEGKSALDLEMKDISCCVGSVFQDPETMFATLTVEDEIAFGPENLLRVRDKIREDVEKLLGLTGIGTYRHNLVWNLSGGQIQKLGLASVLAMEPKLIILDEPTANLDPASTSQVHELILSLREQGMTVLLVTRELDEFLAEADQLLVLDRGKLLYRGEPYGILSERGNDLEQRGIWLPETVEIGLELRRRGYPVDRIPVRVRETLELIQQLNLVSEGTVLTGRDSPTRDETASPLIDGRGIRYSYGGGLYALKGVDIAVRPGEMLAIVGRNGAGKSTLAKLLIGLNKCREGSLNLFGKNSRRWKVPDLANHISLVFQNPEHQFLTDTVADEIDYSLQSRGVNDPEERIRERGKMLGQLGLSEEAERHPFTLSAGNKRRLGVATMLVGHPEVLIVDEPTYGQDREMTRTLMTLLREIRDRGIAVVMISHDMRLVSEYADRVVVMSEGLKHFDGNPTELFDKAEILESASLEPTLLFQILKALGEWGVTCRGNIPRTETFIKLLLKEGEVSLG